MNDRKKIKVEAVSVDMDADTVVLSLRDAVEANDNKVFLNYKTKKKDQLTGVVQDLAGNDLQSIKDLPVSNVTPDTNAPIDYTTSYYSLEANLMLPQNIMNEQSMEEEVLAATITDPFA